MKKLFYFLALTVSIAGLQAQESAITSGGEASGEGGSVSYTVGQVTFGTHAGTTRSVSEGVQQPYEISVITGIEETNFALQISLYPNPTQDFVILKILDDEHLESQRTMTLYDIDGRVIRTKDIISNETTIDMTGLNPQIYFMKISMVQKTKTFKIIKKEL